MVIEKLKRERILSDDDFDDIYPAQIKSLSNRHWTPITIAKKAAEFLCYKKGAKILDAGSGVGKFCLIGGVLHPECTFYGVDFRENLIDVSDNLKARYNIGNVEFIHKDILDMSFDEYECVYFFNSFHEKIDSSAVIDKKSTLSIALYTKYTKHLFDQFCAMPIGTRIATYYTSDFNVPDSYEIVESYLCDNLKFYIKTKNENVKPFSLKFNIESHSRIYGSLSANYFWEKQNQR